MPAPPQRRFWRVARLLLRLLIVAVVVQLIWPIVPTSCVVDVADKLGENQSARKDYPVLYRFVCRDVGEGMAWLGSRVADGLSAATHFVHEYHEDVAAIAAVIIAIYTAILGKATIGLRSAAERQSKDMIRSIKAAEDSAKASRRIAEASIFSSLPGLFVTEIDLGGISSLRAMLPRNWAIRVTVVNFGKSPAFLKEATINAGIYREVPIFPQYRKELVVEKPPVIPEGASYQFWQTLYDQEFDEDDWNSALDGSATFLVFGHFTYTDFMGDEHTFGFSRAWAENQNAFAHDDRPRYNLRHYKPRDT